MIYQFVKTLVSNNYKFSSLWFPETENERKSVFSTQVVHDPRAINNLAGRCGNQIVNESKIGAAAFWTFVFTFWKKLLDQGFIGIFWDSQESNGIRD
ncbi:MAG: hypothetical protein AAB874_07285 [Patescibacteria group bacterium]